MRLSEIQNKDVINLNSGMKVGNIIDIKINSETGKIESLILEKKKFINNYHFICFLVTYLVELVRNRKGLRYVNFKNRRFTCGYW